MVVVLRITPPVDKLGATLEWEMVAPVDWFQHSFEFHPLSDVSQTIELSTISLLVESYTDAAGLCVQHRWPLQ
jgi:hypothetical protein